MPFTKQLAWPLTVALAIAASACDDDERNGRDDNRDAAAPGNPDPDAGGAPDDAGARPDGQAPSDDDGGTPPTGKLALTDWVADLVENHTTDTAQPDTVDDKDVQDTDDPAAFDKYLK